jgi:ribosome-binding ATPase YchF (GTP1/OBG family)
VNDRDLLLNIQKILEAGELLVSSADPHLLIRLNEQMKDLNLLTAKRQIYLLNGKPEEVSAQLLEKIKTIGADYVVADLANAEGIPELIKKAYAVLNLISFFTTGEDETRAWTITRGTKAPQAAGVIHTDFEQKFIRLEVVSYEKLMEAKAWTVAKQKGWIRIEGKEYEVTDGDVLVVRHG